MTHQIAYLDGYRVYRTETGRDRHYVGPTWKTPKEAATYATNLDTGYVSPLRASSESPVLLASPQVPTGTHRAATAALPRATSRPASSR